MARILVRGVCRCLRERIYVKKHRGSLIEIIWHAYLDFHAPGEQIYGSCYIINIRRSHYNLGVRIFRWVGCSGILVPVGIKVRAKTQPNS